MAKSKYRNCRQQRRVELLKEHYEFDEASKTFDIVLHFQKASEIFNERLDLLKKRVMKEEILEEVANLLSDIPKGYKADLSLVIDDYEGIPYEEILDAFHNILKVRLNRFQAAKNSKYYKVGALVLIGILMIATMILGEVMQWWGGESIEGRLVSYVIDTAGCVLIWEGLYSALLERGYDAALGHTLSTRLSTIGLYRNDGSDEALLLERNGEAVIVEKEKLGQKAGASCLYLSGFFLVGAGLIGVLLRTPILASMASAGGLVTFFLLVFELLAAVFYCGLGFLAITMFSENYRYFILTSIAAVIVFALVTSSFVGLFLGQSSPANIITAVFSLFAMTLFVIGFGLSTYHRRHDIKRTLSRKK